MAMGQQEPIEPAEAGSAPEQLALAAFPAIDQDAVASRFDEEAGMVAFCRWNAGRRPSKCQVEHSWLSTSGDSPRFALLICVDGAAGPRQLLPQGTADCMNSQMA